MITKIYKNIAATGFTSTARLILSTIRKALNNKKSYSQYNEDLYIDKLLGFKETGFYIDIGAYDPEKLNNTKLFSERGWKGINIDPNPETIEKFNEQRPNDINLNIGLASSAAELRAVLFEGCRSFTLSSDLIKQREEEKLEIIKDLKVEVKTLKEIFAQHTTEQKVDFISVDTEGLDLEVIKGNDWSKYRPTIVCVETHNEQGDSINYREKIHEFMRAQDYKLAYDTGLNSIFRDTQETN